MNYLNRFLVPGDVKPNAQLSLLDSRPERQYYNQDAQPDLLATLASDRIAGERLLVNYYRIATDFIVSDVMAGINLLDKDSHFINNLRQALWFRTLYGFSAIAFLEDSPIAISPRGVWPIMERGRRIGVAVVIPYNQTSVHVANTVGAALPDRAIVGEIFHDLPSFFYSTEYTGITLGVNFRRISSTARAVIFGDGNSFYSAIEPIVEMLDNVLKSGSSIISRHAKPHLQIPATSVTYNSEGEPSLVVSEEGTIFPVQSIVADDFPY